MYIVALLSELIRVLPKWNFFSVSAHCAEFYSESSSSQRTTCKNKRQFFTNACSNMVFFSHRVAGHKRTVPRSGKNNQKVATFLPRQRLGTSVLTPGWNHWQQRWNKNENNVKSVYRKKMWWLFGCFFQVVGWSACHR